ncbi:metal-dependent hydrolase [Chitinivorax sp. B]|uniref:metal-dependent hydrolase n=1 Tax=Chitinivorax sp. B TaxID=2502235 RepID=UPI0010F812A0|nr:metal-dependent hydrolase [Chitinivorax sp. B]
MLIGHTPAGYLLGHLVQQRAQLPRNIAIFFGLFTANLPDLDMLYFHLIDHRQHHHHTYWTHLPVFWLAVTAIAWLIGRHAALRAYRHWLVLGLANIWLHLLLDSIVGDIWWLYPLINQPFALFTVPATHANWIWSFVLHWSFALEIVVIVWAGWVWYRQPMASRRHQQAVASLD